MYSSVLNILFKEKKKKELNYQKRTRMLEIGEFENFNKNILIMSDVCWVCCSFYDCIPVIIKNTCGDHKSKLQEGFPFVSQTKIILYICTTSRYFHKKSRIVNFYFMLLLQNTCKSIT